MELNKELLTKAKAAKTAEEIMALAKENGMELTEESAGVSRPALPADGRAERRRT